MSLSYGLITAPVSIDDVASALGHGSYDLGTLCQSDKINKWSRRKPIQVNQVTELTEAQWKSNNYGYIIPTYYSRNETWNAFVSGTGWDYTKPTSYFRLTDFEEYNQFATSPFDVTLEESSVSIGSHVRFNMGDLEDIRSWGYFSGFSGTSIHLGIMCSNGGYFQITGITPTFDDVDWEKIFCTIDSANFSAGSSYTFCPVITTYSTTQQTWVYPGDTQIGTWWLLPVQGLVASIYSSGGSGGSGGGGGEGTSSNPFDHLSTDLSTSAMTATDMGTYWKYSGITASAYFALASTYAATASVSISANLYTSNLTESGYEKVLLGSIGSFSLSKGGSATKSISSSVTVQYNNSKEEGELPCTLEVRIEAGQTVYQKTISVTLVATTIN